MYMAFGPITSYFSVERDFRKKLHKVAVKKFREMSHKYYMLYYIIIFVTFKDVKSP